MHAGLCLSAFSIQLRPIELTKALRPVSKSLKNCQRRSADGAKCLIQSALPVLEIV